MENQETKNKTVCKCGCRDEIREGTNFKPGHFQKWRSQQIKAGLGTGQAQESEATPPESSKQEPPQPDPQESPEPKEPSTPTPGSQYNLYKPKPGNGIGRILFTIIKDPERPANPVQVPSTEGADKEDTDKELTLDEMVAEAKTRPHPEIIPEEEGELTPHERITKAQEKVQQQQSGQRTAEKLKKVLATPKKTIIKGAVILLLILILLLLVIARLKNIII